MTNISDQLFRQANRYPESPCLIQALGKKNYRQLSYRQFIEQIEQAANGLKSLKVGTMTVLALPFGIDYCVLVFALFRLGAVPVFIDPRMGLANLRRCLRTVPPQAVIGGKVAQLIVQLVAGKKIPQRFTDCFAPQKSTTSVATGELAAITFTSGSTGTPKAVCYSHKIFRAQIEAFAKIFAIEPGSYDLATFPLFALFGPLLGRTTVLPDMDMTRPAKARADNLWRAIDDFAISTMFCSPAVLDNLASYGQKQRLKLTTVRQILCAGAPVNPRIIKAISPLLSAGTQVLTPYGATEVLPVTASETSTAFANLTAQGKGICVGQPLAEVDVRIIEQEDDGIGEIIVAARWLTSYYDNKDDAKSKLVIDDKIFHRMGDVGYFDKQGRLWYCGRKSQQVSCNGEKISTICYEGIFNNHPAVKRTALIGVKIAGKIQAVICVERLHQVNKNKLCAELQQLADKFSLLVARFIVVKKLPVDKRHNAKINREALQQQFANSV